jgi:hypothetical protein
MFTVTFSNKVTFWYKICTDCTLCQLEQSYHISIGRKEHICHLPIVEKMMYFFFSQEHKKSHKQKITLAVFYYVSSVHMHIFFLVWIPLFHKCKNTTSMSMTLFAIHILKTVLHSANSLVSAASLLFSFVDWLCIREETWLSH